MKYLISYNEASNERREERKRARELYRQHLANQHNTIISTLKDIVLDVSDEGFIVGVDVGDRGENSPMIAVTITKGTPLRSGSEYFDPKDILPSIKRMVEYMKQEGYDWYNILDDVGDRSLKVEDLEKLNNRNKSLLIRFAKVY